MRKVSGFVFWMLLGLAVVIVPIACGSSSNNNDGAPNDMAPVNMTHG
ncbi:MAG TPA: hypothetical protein VN853_15505 [Polyangia bacterium]|jgi:hypothetical protein|nr:hypothetical protein [Polyangia bacterium]